MMRPILTGQIGRLLGQLGQIDQIGQTGLKIETETPPGDHMIERLHQRPQGHEKGQMQGMKTKEVIDHKGHQVHIPGGHPVRVPEVLLLGLADVTYRCLTAEEVTLVRILIT